MGVSVFCVSRDLQNNTCPNTPKQITDITKVYSYMAAIVYFGINLDFHKS